MNCSMMLKDVSWFLNPIKIIQNHSNTLDFEGCCYIGTYTLNALPWQEEHGHLEGKLRVKEAGWIWVMRFDAWTCFGQISNHQQPLGWDVLHHSVRRESSEATVKHMDGSSKQWKPVHFVKFKMYSTIITRSSMQFFEGGWCWMMMESLGCFWLSKSVYVCPRMDLEFHVQIKWFKYFLKLLQAGMYGAWWMLGHLQMFFLLPIEPKVMWN